MPIVAVGRDKLFQALGQTYTDQTFQELCFEYGIELDDVTSERELLRKELQTSEQTSLADVSDEVLYKIDIPANRYDMLCLEGISRALNIFRGRLQDIQYRVADMTGRQPLRMTVSPQTALVRPFMVAAVLRGVTFDAVSYKSFIDLQDKLHQNLCRQRTLVSMGTHDLGTVQGPFTYEALPPEEIEFVPLKQTKSFNARDLLQHYLEHDIKLRKFVPIIQKSLVYPVVLDANRTVLSLPPIINSAHSAITLQTRDVLIECTATDLAKARVVLNTLCTMFSQYCAQPFEVEPVEVIDAFGSTVYPDLSSRSMQVDVDYINRCVGVELAPAKIAELLSRMALAARPTSDGRAVEVSVPPTRSDVLHPCDVMEDVAIAYGYNNIAWTVPNTVTVGREQPLNQLCELLRLEVAMAGWTEVLTWALCSRSETFGDLLREDDGLSAVSVGNPATAEFEVCRTTLLSGLLKTLGASKDAPLPVKLFEVSDVVLVAPVEQSQVGAVNRRRLCAIYCNRESGFEVIHGLLNRVMEMLGVPLLGDFGQARDEVVHKRQVAQYGGGYEWQPSSDPTFFPGRQARILAKGKPVGQFGIIHPGVLQKFDIPFPVSALELDLEPFCFDQAYHALPTHLYVKSAEP